DPDRGLLPRVAPGLFWVAVLLAGLLAISRAFAVEGENGVRDALRLSGLDGAAVFCGKALAVAVQLLALEVVLGFGVVVLYDLHLHNPLVVVLTSLAAEAGLAGAPSEAWPWVQLLAVFGVIYTTMGWLAFGPLLEET